MKIRKREIFDAEQWFPGKDVPGVKGAKPNMLCGCTIAGGPSNMPHVHITTTECELVKPGDWIVTDTKGKKCLIKPDVFGQIYEKVS